MIKKTSIAEVRKIMKDELVQSPFTKKSILDSGFLATMVQLYNEYIDEMEYIGEDPQCELIDFIIDKIEWLENN